MQVVNELGYRTMLSKDKSRPKPPDMPEEFASLTKQIKGGPPTNPSEVAPARLGQPGPPPGALGAHGPNDGHGHGPNDGHGH